MPHASSRNGNSVFTSNDFEDRLEAFDVAWRGETPPAITEFLPPSNSSTVPGHSRHELLTELIKIDLERRWNMSFNGSLDGDCPKLPVLEDYLAEFGELGNLSQLPVELVAHEYELRRRRGESPGHEEYQKRFPDQSDSVKSKLVEIDGAIQRRASATRHLIRCPTCHNRVQLSDDPSASTDAHCRACGSSFSIVKDETLDEGLGVGGRIAHFRNVARLGAGAFGTVWRAFDLRLNREVAIKVPRQTSLNQTEADRFVNEATAAAGLQHPNIVAVHEAGQHGNQLFIVQEYVHGTPLDKWLLRNRPNMRTAARWCHTIASALHYAHQQGVVHRDIKPSNILIDQDDKPHVLDFGLAKHADRNDAVTMTHDGQLLGTAAYMSPEQAKGMAHQADGRSDIYSLGVVLFELLTGETPFRGSVHALVKQAAEDEPPSPRKLNNRVPRDLETICLACLEKEPRRRYATSENLANDLQRYMHNEPITRRPISRPQRAWKWACRRPAMAGLLAVSVLAAVSTSFVGVTLWQMAKAEAQRDQEKYDADQLRHRGKLITLASFRSQITEAKGNELEQVRPTVQSFLDEMIDAEGFEQIREDTKNLLSKIDRRLESTKATKAADKRYEEFEADYHAAISSCLPFSREEQDHRIAMARRKAEEALVKAGMREGKKPIWENPSLGSKQEQAESMAYELLRILADSMTSSDGEQISKRQAKKVIDDFLAGGKIPPELEAADSFMKGKLLADDEKADGKKVQAAIKRFDDALLENPSHFWAKFFRGWCYVRLGLQSDSQVDRKVNFEIAGQELAQCADARDGFVWSHLLLGMVNGKLKRFDLARRHFQDAESHLSDNQAADYYFHVFKGDVLFHEKEIAEALKVLGEIDPRESEKEFLSNAVLAQIHHNQEKHEKAEDYRKKAFGAAAKRGGVPGWEKPLFIRLYRDRAKMYQDTKHFTQALESMHEAMESETNPRLKALDHAWMGAIYGQMENYEDAQKEFAKARLEKAVRDHAITNWHHALIFTKQAEKTQDRVRREELWRQALASLDAVVLSGKATARVHHRRAVVRFELKDYTKAIDDLSAAIEKEPTADLYHFRGRANLIIGSWLSAYDDFEAFINPVKHEGDSAINNRDKGVAYIKQAFCLAAMEETDNAVRKVESGLRLIESTDPLGVSDQWLAARVYAKAIVGMPLPKEKDKKEKYRRLIGVFQKRGIDHLMNAFSLAKNKNKTAAYRFWKTVERDRALTPLKVLGEYRKLSAEYEKQEKDNE